MHKFVRNLITEWRRLDLPTGDETIVIAVSGGADSMSLLLAVHDLIKRDKLRLRIVAAHFDHRLRGAESDADQEFVRGLTTERGIEFAVENAGQLTEGNTEQNARFARYDFLSRTARNLNAFAVLTGHTLNDQAETFLMNLIRGSGLDGLCGMKPVRPLGDLTPVPADGCEAGDEDVGAPLLFPVSTLLVRPILTWAKREDTEAFCHDSGIAYRYDTMNEDTAFKRVRIRKILLPLLRDMNPNIIETLANTASLMQHLPENLHLAGQPPPPDKLSLAEIKTLPKSELYATLRKWLEQHRGTTRQLQLKHIQAIERLMLSEKSGRFAELPGGRVTKSDGRLIYEENKVEN